MAFYSSRVDDEGNELERRLTARSTKSSISSNASRLLSASSRSSGAPYEKIRHINPAAFIETTDFSDSSLIEEGSHDESEILSKSNIVPPLDLQSEGANTHRDFTFSYRKHCEQSIVDPQLAYNTWLSAKRKVKSDEALRRKAEEEAKRLAEEERKQKAHEEYQKWLKKKEASSKQKQSNKPMPPSQLSNATNSHSNTSIKSSKSQKTINEEEALARLEEWEKKKRLQEEKKRLLKQKEEERKQREEEERRQLAAEAWEKWKSTAATKPKPVPLNQGFFTLRGTISNIYVNPNEWQT